MMVGPPGQDAYTKVWVPIINSGASDEELLYFVMPRNRCLQNFERHLQGSCLSDWTQVDTAPAQPPVIHDMGFFTDCIGNFMANLFNKAHWTEQANYILQVIHKSKTMTPRKQFLS
jgi:hypothetical protein